MKISKPIILRLFIENADKATKRSRAIISTTEISFDTLQWLSKFDIYDNRAKSVRTRATETNG